MLIGVGFAPAYDRFALSISQCFSSLNVSEDWTRYPDLLQFFEVNMGSSVLKSNFGSSLLSLNPNFVSDLWMYDKAVMGLIRQLPVFLIPNAYRFRKKLVLSIKKWHAYARAYDDDERAIQKGPSNEAWGSGLMRDRNEMLRGLSNQDYDSVASTDLALIWA